jgi:hypothetical protein
MTEAGGSVCSHLEMGIAYMHFVRRSRSICRANDCFQAEGDGARGKIDDFKEYHTVACWQLLAIYLNSVVNPLGLS